MSKNFRIFGPSFLSMAKIHFRPYTTKQILLFPQRIDENIAEDDPVRLVNSLIDMLDLTSFRKLYKEYGRSPFHPRMMLKAVIYGYMNNVYSCRKIEERLLRDVHFIWLAGYEKPDFITINRFRNRVKDEINNVFTQLVLLLSAKGLVSCLHADIGHLVSQLLHQCLLVFHIILNNKRLSPAKVVQIERNAKGKLIFLIYFLLLLIHQAAYCHPHLVWLVLPDE